MQASLEQLGGLERRLNIAVPREEIESEVESRLRRLQRTVRMHGFRPGKVPLRIVAQQYGAQVREEVLGETVRKSFGEAVREQNLRVAGAPQIEARAQASESGNFEYSATFEVYPEVRPGDFSGGPIERPVHQVVDADVDATIEILRKQRVSFVPVDRPVAGGDRVNLDYRGSVDGQEVAGATASGQHVVVGQGRLVEGFEDALLGVAAGQDKSFEVRFPDDYHGAEMAGKTARFDVHVNEVAEPRLPEVDADFARSLGVADGDLGRMRADIRENLEQEVARRTKSRVKEQVMQRLLESTAVEVPKALVTGEAQRLAQEAQRDLASRGVQVQGLALGADSFEDAARRRVTLGLIIGELVKAHGLEAKPDQVRAVVEDLGRSYEQPEEVVRWHYQRPERLQPIESMVLEDNVVAWVLEKSQVTDKAVSFDELMGNS